MPHAPAHGTPHHTHATPNQAQILDLDAEVLADHLADITAWLPIATPPRHIVDLGAGTGAGTFALLDRFPHGQVTAVDSSEAHLARLREKAQERGTADQISTVLADLDDPEWPDLGTPDLVWASASIHHLADPHRALRTVHDTLAPGGLFALIELAGFPRFLPENTPEDQPGLEERCHAALEHYHAEQVPHRGADWGPTLTDTGFRRENERVFTIDIAHAHDETVGEYALQGLRRIRDRVHATLSPDDRSALDQLLDPTSPHFLLRRHDLAVRTERTAWAARK